VITLPNRGPDNRRPASPCHPPGGAGRDRRRQPGSVRGRAPRV